jgi:crotonobetainyl-CoA:carnitine CoA-transferase CaiB-like acyl-CoA transferase
MLPLEGIRILDMGQFWAGPNAGRAWADAGAEVIKVESCARPDPLRIQARGIYPGHEPGIDHWNRSGMVNERNRSKLSLAIDLQKPRGRELFLELVKVSDVISQNFSTRVMPGLGLDYETVSQVNERIIMVSIMSQGLTGPEKDYVSYGPNLEQLSGISYFSGYPDDPHSSVGFALPDPLGGAVASFALLAALRHRELTGRGMQVDISQREAATMVVGQELVEYSLTGRIPPRLGNHERGRIPSDCYPCAGDDQWVAISIGSDTNWAGLCRAMQRPDLIDDQRFHTIVQRMRHRAELDNIISSWTTRHQKDWLMATLQAWQVPAGAVLNPRELFSDPHLRRRGFWEAISDFSAGPQEYYGRPYRSSLFNFKTRTPTPTLGQHNRQILGGLLGLTDDELDSLEADGIIGTKPILSAEGGIAHRE